MSGVKSFMSDIGNLLMDPKTSDIVMVCQGEQIKAHRLILSARSPVFAAMLQSDMSESVNGEIKIDDVDKDVIKEMLRYMYKVEVEDGFTKFKELLVLADKYQVEELVKFCGSKIVESLNKDNVFQIGTLAETHNAGDLLKECVQFVLNNAPGCLDQDWEDQIKDSPKMMLQMLQYYMKTQRNNILEINRSGEVGVRLAVEPLRATAFQVDSKVLLCGVGMYGSNYSGDMFAVNLMVLNDANQCLLEETKGIKSDGSKKVNKMLFSKPISVEANKKYHITAKISCPQRCDIQLGRNYKEIVNSSGKNPFKVTFFTSKYNEFSRDAVTQGPFPSLYFYK